MIGDSSGLSVRGGMLGALDTSGFLGLIGGIPSGEIARGVWERGGDEGMRPLKVVAVAVRGGLSGRSRSEGEGTIY